MLKLRERFKVYNIDEYIYITRQTYFGIFGFTT